MVTFYKIENELGEVGTVSSCTDFFYVQQSILVENVSKSCKKHAEIIEQHEKITVKERVRRENELKAMYKLLS